jgi:hypothetical protein
MVVLLFVLATTQHAMDSLVTVSLVTVGHVVNFLMQ